ncbi:hypothetical protein vseg_016990 [Gypsophila vaccaria]
MAPTILLLLLFTTTTTTTATASTTTNHKTAELNSIIDAIISAGDFTNWAKLLSTAANFSATSTAFSATAFVPVSADSKNNNPILLPRRLSFSQLQLFPTGTRLPTVVPGATVSVTNNSAINFTLGGRVRVSNPDVFQNDVVCVHGVVEVESSSLPLEGTYSSPASRRKPPGVDVQPRVPVVVRNGGNKTVSFSTGKVKVVVLVFLVLSLMW